VRRDVSAAQAYLAPEPAPVVPTFRTPEPVARAPEPVIHVAEERVLEPIIDPWVEAFEQDHGRPGAVPPPVGQGDLYLDRPAGAAAPAEYGEPVHDERDHRKSGWSLFGKKPRAQTAYAPSAQAAPRGQPQPQLRQTAQPQPDPTGSEDDLEIPSFLRRLAN
jgi:cell division protein FtsZ